MSVQPHKSLVLHLDTAAGLRFAGAVTAAEVVSEGAAIVGEFPRRNGPTLEIGEGVSLLFPGLRPGEPFHTPGQAITRTEDGRRLLYRFTVGQAVGSALTNLADWRFATRVRPFSQAPIQASVEDRSQGPRFPAQVKDISATGVGLRVAMENDLKLSSTWQLKVSLALPGQQQTVEMVGNICYRRLDGNAILYGVDFDTNATLAFDGMQALVNAYVSGCQSAAICMLRDAL